MAAEPVVLAPEPLPSGLVCGGPSPGRALLLPSSVAAGFMLVIGTFVVLGPGIRHRRRRRSRTAPRRTRRTDSPGVDRGLAAETVALNGRMIRDARLERYLAAHKQFAGTSALGVLPPSCAARRSTPSR
jgi:sigma-E factor negative regulatory protein RseA